MKQLVLLFYGFLFSVAVYAQQLPFNYSKLNWKEHTLDYSTIQDKSGAQIIDHFTAEALRNQNFSVFNLPLRTDAPGDSLPVRFAIATFDTLLRADTLIGFSGRQPTSFEIDSLQIGMLHVRNSDVPDTIEVSVIGLTNSGFPNETNVLFNEVFTQTSALGGGAFFYLKLVPGIVIPAQTAIGVKVTYRGGSAQDSLFWRAGTSTNGICANGGLRPVQHRCYPTTFAYVERYQRILPTEAGSDVFTDCSGSGLFDPDEDGASPFQALDVRLFIQGESLNRNPVNSTETILFPNPSDGPLYINCGNGVNTIQQLRITNLLGQEVAYWETLPCGRLWDAEKYDAGVYVISWSGGMQKWIKQ